VQKPDLDRMPSRRNREIEKTIFGRSTRRLKPIDNKLWNEVLGREVILEMLRLFPGDIRIKGKFNDYVGRPWPSPCVNAPRARSTNDP
jgi:hypothetical protein